MNTEPNFTMPLADAALLKLFSGVTASSTTSAFALLQLLWWFGDPQLSLSSGVAACSLGAYILPLLWEESADACMHELRVGNCSPAAIIPMNFQDECL